MSKIARCRFAILCALLLFSLGRDISTADAAALFGNNGSELFSIDPNTAVPTSIGHSMIGAGHLALQSLAFDPTAIPEPSTLTLFGLGLLGLGAARRRRKTTSTPR